MICSGKNYLQQLVEAFGLKGHKIRKLVLECDVRDAIKLHIVKFVEDKELDNFPAPPKEVEVIEQDVTVTPFGEVLPK